VAGSSRREAREGFLGVDSGSWNDGGAIFGQTQERQFWRATVRTDGPVGVGQEGTEGHEGRVHGCFAHSYTV